MGFNHLTPSLFSLSSSFSTDTATTTFLEAAVRAGEISRDYDDIMTSFREAFFAKNAERMDYIEQVKKLVDNLMLGYGGVDAKGRINLHKAEQLCIFCTCLT